MEGASANVIFAHFGQLDPSTSAVRGQVDACFDLKDLVFRDFGHL